MRRVACLVLPLLLVVACGGGSNLSKADYLSKAEKICKDANDAFKALPSPKDPASFQSLVDKTVEIADKAAQDLKALDPPAADKEDIDKKVIEPLEDQVAEGKKFRDDVRKAVANKDQAALGRLLQNPPSGKEADLDWMTSYGYKDCVDAARTDR